jgi:hypothetical protein
MLTAAFPLLYSTKALPFLAEDKTNIEISPCCKIRKLISNLKIINLIILPLIKICANYRNYNLHSLYHHQLLSI